MSEVSVPWGAGQLSFELPQHWAVQQLAAASLRPAPEDWPDRMAAALAKPGTGRPLGELLPASKGGKVVLVIEDITRHSPLSEILAIVMREVRHAGVGDRQIEIVFATGMHPPMTGEQGAGKLGPEAADLPWRCNPWHDESAYVDLGRHGSVPICIDRGVLAADLRIIISAVTPHLQAGFGGGYKMLFPGCAHLETIRALHRLGVGRRARQWVGSEAARNPMRIATDAAGQAVDRAHGTTFAVQYVLDEADKPTYIAAGQVIPSQQMLAKQAAVACGIFTEQPADVVITNAYPRDLDLWQCFKSIANTLWAARPDGAIICLARCEAGLNGMDPPPWPFSPAWTRRLVRLTRPEPLSSLLMRIVPRLAGDAAFFVRIALQSLYRNPIFMVSPAFCQAGGKFPGVALFPTVEAAIAAADAHLPAGTQRVTVFPMGGITYPVARAR